MADRETPLTLPGIARNLGPIAMAFGIVVGGAVAWTTTQARLHDVEKDLADMKKSYIDGDERFRALEKQLASLNRKLDVVLLCNRDPQRCDEQIRLLSAIQ